MCASGLIPTLVVGADFASLLSLLPQERRGGTAGSLVINLNY